MPEASKPSRRRWWFCILAVVIMIGCGAGLVLWNRWASEKFAREIARSEPIDKLASEKSAPEPARSEPIDADGRYRRLVVGTWQDEYQGKRTMTLNADGTGTMIVELRGWRATLSAPRLKFNMKWSVENGHLKKQTVSGEPETQVKIILNTMGDHVDEPIMELTENRLLLLDQDGKTKYDWKRLKANQ